MNRVAVVACAVAALSLTACQPSRSTRMTAEDLEEMARAMAQSLAASPAIVQRNADSPRWVVSIDKVLNLTSDVMTPAEQWYVIARLRSSLPMSALAESRNIVFVIPAEQARRMRSDPDAQTFSEDFASDRRPTHQMTATFRSVDRAIAMHATTMYYAEFELIDLTTGEPVWIDRFEYKREARGHVWD